MKKNNNSLTKYAASLLAIPLSVGSLKASDSDVRLRDCPPAVQATIQSQARNMPIEDVARHSIDGREIYVAEILLDQEKDLKVYVSQNGDLLKTRRDIDEASIPLPVREAFSSHQGAIEDVEVVTENETVTFHVELDRTTKGDLNLVITPKGKIISKITEIED